jgi:hypothetical protein
VLVRLSVGLRLRARTLLAPAIGVGYATLHAVMHVQFTPLGVAFLLTASGVLIERVASSARRIDQSQMIITQDQSEEGQDQSEEGQDQLSEGKADNASEGVAERIVFTCTGEPRKLVQGVHMTEHGPVTYAYLLRHDKN